MDVASHILGNQPQKTRSLEVEASKGQQRVLEKEERSTDAATAACEKRHRPFFHEVQVEDAVARPLSFRPQGPVELISDRKALKRLP